jgi:hypothetical protein
MNNTGNTLNKKNKKKKNKAKYAAFCHRSPHGMGDLYAAQTGGVGFHSFPGEGAAS